MWGKARWKGAAGCCWAEVKLSWKQLQLQPLPLAVGCCQNQQPQWKANLTFAVIIHTPWKCFLFIFINTNNINVTDAKPLLDIRLNLNCNQLNLIAHKLIPRELLSWSQLSQVILLHKYVCTYIHFYVSVCACKRVTRLICMSLLSVIDSFRRDQAAIESTWSTPLAVLDTPLNSPFSLCHSLTLTLAAAIAAAAAAVNDSNKVEAAFLYLFFFCRVVSAVSFYLSLARLRSLAVLRWECVAVSVWRCVGTRTETARS